MVSEKSDSTGSDRTMRFEDFSTRHRGSTVCHSPDEDFNGGKSSASAMEDHMTASDYIFTDVPKLKSIFLCEFHTEKGPVITLKVDDDGFDSDEILEESRFSSFSAALIPRDELLNTPIKVGIYLDQLCFKIIAVPVGLQSVEIYERGKYQFCVCFLVPHVARLDENDVVYEAVLAKLTDYLLDLEEEEMFLSHRPSDDALLKFFRTMLSSLNSNGTLEYTLTPTMRVYLKMYPTNDKQEPPQVYQHTVGILKRRIDMSASVLDKTDIVTQKVLPLINGKRCVKEISIRTNLGVDLVCRCLRNLCYYDIIGLAPLFLYSNNYVATERLHNFFFENPIYVQECLEFVQLRDIPSQQKPGEKPPHPPFSDVFRLYLNLKIGQRLVDFVVEHKPSDQGICVERFIQYGMMMGFLRRLSTYPIYTKETVSRRRREESPILKETLPPQDNRAEEVDVLSEPSLASEKASPHSVSASEKSSDKRGNVPPPLDLSACRHESFLKKKKKKALRSALRSAAASSSHEKRVRFFKFDSPSETKGIDDQAEDGSSVSSCEEALPCLVPRPRRRLRRFTNSRLSGKISPRAIHLLESWFPMFREKKQTVLERARLYSEIYEEISDILEPFGYKGTGQAVFHNYERVRELALRKRVKLPHRFKKDIESRHDNADYSHKEEITIETLLRRLKRFIRNRTEESNECDTPTTPSLPAEKPDMDKAACCDLPEGLLGNTDAATMEEYLGTTVPVSVLESLCTSVKEMDVSSSHENDIRSRPNEPMSPDETKKPSEVCWNQLAESHHLFRALISPLLIPRRHRNSHSHAVHEHHIFMHRRHLKQLKQNVQANVAQLERFLDELDAAVEHERQVLPQQDRTSRDNLMTLCDGTRSLEDLAVIYAVEPGLLYKKLLNSGRFTFISK